MKNKLIKLEAIRGIAAIYVVFHHSFLSENFTVFHHNLSFLFKFGQEAVILFFLMSGFVIGYSFENSRDKSFKSYFQKRFYRIYIPLFIVILTNYALVCYKEGAFITPQWVQLLGNLFMLQDVSALKPNVICAPFLGNTPLWSLSYEWWFYMMFYLFYSIISKFEKVDLFVSALVIVSAITYIWYPFFVNRLFMYYGIWWAGVVMARSFMKNSFVSLKDMKVSIFTLVAATLILSLNLYLHKDLYVSIGISPVLEIRHFGFTLVAIIIALVWQKCKWIYFDAIFGRFALLAPFSYVIYISHYFLVAKADYFPFIGNKYLAFFLYLGVTFIYSYLIEVKVFPYLRGILIKKN